MGKRKRVLKGHQPAEGGERPRPEDIEVHPPGGLSEIPTKGEKTVGVNLGGGKWKEKKIAEEKEIGVPFQSWGEKVAYLIK